MLESSKLSVILRLVNLKVVIFEAAIKVNSTNIRNIHLLRCLCLLLSLCCSPGWAQESLRLVSLAPDITRNLISLGAQSQVVGIIEHPQLQLALPQARVVGDYQLLNIEAILALQPDYVLVWQGGNPEAQLQRIESLGLTVVRIKSDRLADLPHQWQFLGKLLNREDQASRLIEQFNLALDSYRVKAERPVRTFYQLWHQPLMSINNSGYQAEVLQLCGAENVLAEAFEAFPQVGVEAVLAADVELILASDELPSDWRDRWMEWPQIPAVQRDQLHTVEADYLHQLTLDTLKGIDQVCSAVERAR